MRSLKAALYRSAASLAPRVGLGEALDGYMREHSGFTPWRDKTDTMHMRVVMAAVLRADSNCIDIGANEGSILRMMVNIAPRGHHVAVEPVPFLAASLRSAHPDVEVHELALDDHAGLATFEIVADNPALSSLNPSGLALRYERHQVDVEVSRLDDILPAGYRPNLVKIDVEGAEDRVLKGAEDTLAEHRPVIILEHGGSALGTVSTEVVFDLLAGYRIFDIDGGGPYSSAEMTDRVASGKLWSWVAVPDQ